jgi:ADP-heptose:LPS heptosyltransferase
MVTDLVDGPSPAPYQAGDWPAPACAAFDAPAAPYAVLHVEASTPLKHWEDAKWFSLAESLASSNIRPVWSAGPAGEGMLRRIDPQARFVALGHRLDLAQLWHLVAGAKLLVCPDTSVMHLGRLTATPTVALYGPSSPLLFGPGDFWRLVPTRAVAIGDFPCRDQARLFKREIAWIRRCQRTAPECAARTGDAPVPPRCMRALEVDAVLAAASSLS